MTDVSIASACEQAFEDYPRSLGDRYEPASATYAAGRVLELLGQPEQALDVYINALSEPSAQPWSLLLNALVRSAKASGLQEAAAIWLAERAAEPPLMPELALVSGHLYASLGRPNDALPLLQTCQTELANHPLSYWAARELMGALVALGRIPEAIETGQDAIVRHPQQEGELRSDLAGLFAASCRFEESLAQAKLALACEPQLAIAHFVFGAALLKLGRRAEAEQEMTTAVELDPAIESWTTALLSEAE